jgi:polysaccharide export outer membrane protein
MIVFSDRVRHVVLAGTGVVAIVLTAGCADTRGGTLPYDKPLAAPDEQHFQTLPEDYKIAPMDTLAVKLYQGNLMPGQDQISGDYSVDLAGHISLPLVGEVEAANLTTAELDNKLSQLYGAKYFEHPDVSVAIKKSTAHVVTVDGAVQKGGQFAIAGPITLIQAISLAEGTRDDANPRRLAIFRTVGGQRQAAAFDLTAIRRGEAPDPQVYPGDIIVVDGSKVKAAEKQIFSALPLVGIFRPF